jgi:hypothetical protein
VAISNNRLLDIDQDKVTFRYKDYRHDSQQKTMSLDAEEFIRRFLLHVLPDGFQRIRYYGFLGNRYREEKLARCRQLLGMAERPVLEGSQDYRDRCEELTGSSLRECPILVLGFLKEISSLKSSFRSSIKVRNSASSVLGATASTFGTATSAAPMISESTWSRLEAYNRRSSAPMPRRANAYISTYRSQLSEMHQTDLPTNAAYL